MLNHVPAERIYSREGQSYVRRLLNPTLPNEIYNCRKIYKMRQHVFQKFCNLLTTEGVIDDKKNITVQEQLAMFLVIVGQDQRYGVTMEQFRRSSWSVNTYFNKMLDAIVRLHDILIVDHSTGTPDRIKNDPKVFPHFKDCIGAIDGTHVKATIYGGETTRYRNKKGDLSQNVMATCNFNMKFTYILGGWEGSAADARVLQDSLTRDNGLKVPYGKYYLVDVGYPNRPQFISPYRGARYHLSEYDGDRLPSNAVENFNYRHSQLRMVIERTFGVVKHRFAILRGCMPFPFESQVKIVLACFLLHNFIRKEDTSDLLEDFDDELNDIEDGTQTCQVGEEEWEECTTQAELSQQQKKEKADQMRDFLANSTWLD